MARNVMVVFSNAAPGRDDEFNRWYDEIHVGEVLSIPPIKACQRFKIASAQMEENLPHRYLALYEFEGDPKVALEALTAASGSLNMSDTLQDSQLILVEPISERVTSD